MSRRLKILVAVVDGSLFNLCGSIIGSDGKDGLGGGFDFIII